MLQAGNEPEIFVIEHSPTDWVEAEQFWISYFRSIGCRLANLTQGGDGLSGMRHSPEAIEKTRRAHIGSKRSEATREKLRASWTPERKAAHIAMCKAREMSQEQRDFLSKLHSGKTLSLEQRAQISARFKGRRQTEEQKRKSGDGVRASWTPERRAAQAERSRAMAASRPLKTHCKHGHPFDGDNLYVKPNGARGCRTCLREQQRVRKQTKRMAGVQNVD